MVRPVMRAVFPGYAMMASDPKRLSAAFVKVYSLVLLFALPAAAGIALLAEPLVTVLLGARWHDAIPMVQVLAIYGGIRAAQANTGSVYMALDRPQLAAAMTFLNIVLGFGSFAAALGPFPIAQAARFLVLGSLVAAAVNLFVLGRLLRLSWRDFSAALLGPGIGVAVMAAALLTLRAPLWNDGHPLAAGALVLVLLVGAGALTYVATVLFAWNARGRPSNSAEHGVVTALAGTIRGRGPA